MKTRIPESLLKYETPILVSSNFKPSTASSSQSGKRPKT